MIYIFFLPSLFTELKPRVSPCSLPVRVAPSGAPRPLQVRRRSPRGAELGSGAQANQAPPHHFHRGAAGRAGGAVPAEPVSRCKHQGEAGAERTPEGGESRGTFDRSRPVFSAGLERIQLPCSHFQDVRIQTVVL